MIKTTDDVLIHNELLRKEAVASMNNFTWETLDNCHCCLSNDIHSHFEKWGFQFSICSNCGYQFVNPRPSPQDLYKMYSSSKASLFFQEVIIQKSRQERIDRIHIPRVHHINQFCPTKGKLLDIGCSTGLFLEAAISDGWECYGSEFSQSAVDVCKLSGYSVSDKNLSDAFWLELSPFQVISCFEVLEHTSDPRSFLSMVAKLLEPNGILALSVPCMDGIEYKVAGTSHENICPPNHLNYFTKKSLAKLLSSFSLNPISLTTPGLFDVSYVRSYLSTSENLTTGCDWLDSLIINDDVFSAHLQTAISDSGNSGHLFVIAQKS